MAALLGSCCFERWPRHVCHNVLKGMLRGGQELWDSRGFDRAMSVVLVRDTVFIVIPRL